MAAPTVTRIMWRGPLPAPRRCAASPAAAGPHGKGVEWGSAPAGAEPVLRQRRGVGVVLDPGRDAEALADEAGEGDVAPAGQGGRRRPDAPPRGAGGRRGDADGYEGAPGPGRPRRGRHALDDGVAACLRLGRAQVAAEDVQRIVKAEAEDLRAAPVDAEDVGRRAHALRLRANGLR